MKIKIYNFLHSFNGMNPGIVNINMRKYSDSATKKIIENIDFITLTDSYISAGLKNGKIIKVTYEGNSNVKISRSNNLRRICICNKLITLERFILICYDIINENFDFILKNHTLVCNVKDNSSSLRFIRKHNMITNLRPDNLEWCTSKQNSTHYSTLIEIEKITKHVFAISAKDIGLVKFMETCRKKGKKQFKIRLMAYLKNGNYPLLK